MMKMFFALLLTAERRVDADILTESEDTCSTDPLGSYLVLKWCRDLKWCSDTSVPGD